jgi:hypothetical protein
MLLRHVFCWMMVGGLLFSGCDGRQKKVRARNAAVANAPASLEEVFKGKTSGGKPVRAYKVILQAPFGEHLLLVLGDPSVPVSMSTAAAVKIGGKDQASPYLCMGSGMVFVAKTDGQFLDAALGEMEPNAGPPLPSKENTKPTFPMEKFTKKVSGGVLQWPEVDKL